MSTMTASSFVSLTFDIQAFFYRSGADIAMFLTAMFVYWILQRVKTNVALVKTHCKDSFVVGDQECPSERTIDISVGQVPPSQACGVDAIVCPVKVVQPQPQPKPRTAVNAKVVQPKQSVPLKGPFIVSEHMALMRDFAARRNIKETLQEFRLIQENGERLTSAMYNTVLQGWVNCGNIWAAENCMEEITEAGLADETSFVILIKALVPIGDQEKARALLHEMKEKVPSPSATAFDELLLCFAKRGLFNDGISLLKCMHEVGVQPNQSTLRAIAKLVNSARAIHLKFVEVWEVLSKYDFGSKCTDEASQKYPSQLPRLAAVLSRAENNDSKTCFHDVEIKGSMAAIEAACATLKQHDFLHAFVGACGADKQQEEMKHAQAAAVLRCVSKQGLGMPSNLETVMSEFLGNDVHFLRLSFESSSIRVVELDEISCRHPRLGFRHCWVKKSFGACGQRTFSNGEEIDEAAFHRHINA